MKIFLNYAIIITSVIFIFISRLTSLFWFVLIRLLYSVKEPEPVLVFEDVTMSGYGLSSGPLNVDGTKFVAAKLAKFHAASLFLDHEVGMFSFDKKQSCKRVF